MIEEVCPSTILQLNLAALLALPVITIRREEEVLTEFF
jgi:hypothetical protein